MKKVSIIIVNWNGINHLKKCLPSLARVSYDNVEIILVDNASTDGSVEYVVKFFPKIKIVGNKKNIGFAGGNNKGVAKARGDYVLLLNNDTVVTRSFVNELVKVLDENAAVGVVQGKILSMDYRSRLDSVGAFFTYTGFLYHYGYFQKDKKKYDNTKYLYTAKGACMMIRKVLIDKIGLFDNDYFAYFEETDFCNRVWLSGYKVVYAPKSVVYHKVGGTSNSMNNAFIQFHSFKNRINSYLKNLEAINLLILLPQHLLLCEIAALSFIFKRRFDLFIAINKAIIWNVENLKKTLSKRKVIQEKFRVVRDKEYMTIIFRDPGLKYYYYLFAKSLVGYKE